MNKRREKKAFKKLFDMSRNMTSKEIKVAHKTFVRMLWSEVISLNGTSNKSDS